MNYSHIDTYRLSVLLWVYIPYVIGISLLWHAMQYSLSLNSTWYQNPFLWFFQGNPSSFNPFSPRISLICTCLLTREAISFTYAYLWEMTVLHSNSTSELVIFLLASLLFIASGWSLLKTTFDGSIDRVKAQLMAEGNRNIALTIWIHSLHG